MPPEAVGRLHCTAGRPVRVVIREGESDQRAKMAGNDSKSWTKKLALKAGKMCCYVLRKRERRKIRWRRAWGKNIAERGGGVIRVFEDRIGLGRATAVCRQRHPP